jgi:glutamate racemase
MTGMAQPAAVGLANRQPVGIFDSGVGGLSVAREIRRALPAENLLYVADTAYCPYGDRPVDEVRERALAVGRHLEAAGAKVVIVACNTATGAALESLREALTVPVIGLEPAVKTGAARTRNRRVGVMATASTLRSERFARLVLAHGDGVEVLAQPCPGLVDLIEQGHLDGDVLAARVEELTQPLRDAQVDTVVLGCTHYPFVAEALRRALGPGVEIVDSGPAIARRLQQVLQDGGLAVATGPGSLRVRTTGEPGAVQPVVDRLWGAPVELDRVTISSPPRRDG